jgi:gas vesicle protein
MAWGMPQCVVMKEWQLLDGLVGAIIGALIGAVPAILAWRAAVASNKTAKESLAVAQRQAVAADHANQISADALSTAQREAAAAEAAVEEATEARRIQYADWHRQAQPPMTLEADPRGADRFGMFLLIFSCEKRFDSCKITLVTPRGTRFAGVGRSLYWPGDEADRAKAYGQSYSIGPSESGSPCSLGLQVMKDADRPPILRMNDPRALEKTIKDVEGLSVRFRCEVTIDGESWEAVKVVDLPQRPTPWASL